MAGSRDDVQISRCDLGQRAGPPAAKAIDDLFGDLFIGDRKTELLLSFRRDRQSGSGHMHRAPCGGVEQCIQVRGKHEPQFDTEIFRKQLCQCVLEAIGSVRALKIDRGCVSRADHQHTLLLYALQQWSGRLLQ
jgi:hypothetical protein